MTDELLMRRCIELARCGRAGAAPNPMVGAVVVCDGRIVGEGYHARCGEAHAEVNAIASVGDEAVLRRSTLYVSLEPCAHYGKTPPCAELIIRKGIRRVVVGTVDPFAQVQGRGIEMLREAGVEVRVGVLEEECRRLNEQFFTAHTAGRPFVALKWAQSSDGYVAPAEGEGSIFVSNTRTLARVHRLRTEYQAILVGSGTALSDNPALTVRYFGGRQPVRVVIDRWGKLPGELRLFDGAAPTRVFGYRDNEERALQEGRTYRFCKLREGEDALPQVLGALLDEGIISVLVEGGPTIHKLFIESGLWDRAHVEIGDCVFGRGVAAPALPGSLSAVERVGGHLMLTMEREKHEVAGPSGVLASAGMRGQELLSAIVGAIAPVFGAGEAKAVARTLVEDLTGRSIVELLTRRVGELLDECSIDRLNVAVGRLAAGEPVQYVVGSALFCGLRLGVSPAVLIPRPETEQLVEFVIENSREGAAILDLGTGSGCIALALASRLPGSRVVGVDVSEDALSVARANLCAARQQTGRLLQVEFVEGDILDEATLPAEEFGIIVGNPPYISPDERGTLATWVSGHEPQLALFAPAADPIAFYRHIVHYASGHLGRGGRLYFEINPRYAAAIAALCEEQGFARVETLCDMSGKIRYIAAKL